jgi:hypothetical protein
MFHLHKSEFDPYGRVSVYLRVSWTSGEPATIFKQRGVQVDTSLIAKSLRTIPRNYPRPLPVPALESSLRGAIYDPYVHRVVWEGVGRGTGRWEGKRDRPEVLNAGEPHGSADRFGRASGITLNYSHCMTPYSSENNGRSNLVI